MMIFVNYKLRGAIVSENRNSEFIIVIIIFIILNDITHYTLCGTMLLFFAFIPITKVSLKNNLLVKL